MSNYFIEFSIANIILYLFYALFLKNETNLRFRRSYLLLANVLALAIPFMSLPQKAQVPTINFMETLPEIVLVNDSIMSQTSVQSQAMQWTQVLYIVVVLALVIRFAIGLIRIYSIYKTSNTEILNDTKVYTTTNSRSSFAFFNLIFISKVNSEPKPEIIQHEKAHVSYGHTYDLVFLNILTIVFWWVPTVWLFLREAILVHEYQADRFVIRQFDYNRYKSTLITCKLTESGLYLSNYFNDIQLSKRLKNMKKLNIKIKSWKLTMLIVSITLTVYVFACQQQGITELQPAPATDDINGVAFQIVEETAKFPGGITEFYTYVSTSLTYPEKAIKNGVQGKVFVEFVANKDGSISDVKVLKGIGFGCDEEALRVMRNSPDWIPAQHKATKVRQKMVLPITFKLDNNSDINSISSKTATSETVTLELGTLYPDGLPAFMDYLASNLEYPAEAKAKGIEGLVQVGFIVEADGTIGNVTLLKGIGSGCDAEAVRLIKNSPNWTPKLDENGKPVASKVVLPIRFKLPE